MNRSLGTLVCLFVVAAAPVLAAETAAPSRFATVDRIIDEAIAKHDIPGAVLLVGQGNEIVYRRAYGNRSVEPAKVPMTPDTIFDLASLSKVVGTATSVMLLVDRGGLKVTDKVAQHLPAFAANGKGDITIEQLLLHRGGLVPDNSLKDYEDGPEKAWERIFALPTVYAPGTRFQYTDVGFMVLGAIVQKVSGRPLGEFARQEVFEPLGMKDTCYNPPPSVHERIAPTEQRNGRWIVGEVHDPRAYKLGGVAGHAGVFSTADDLSRLCRMILGGGQLDGRRLLSAATVSEMTKGRPLPDGGGVRGYGWDVDTAYSSPRGRIFPRGTSFGHTGFTGTAFWIDPEHKCYVIFLTNAVHPKDRGSRAIVALRREVDTAVASALLGIADPAAGALAAASKAPSPVLCGIDVLEREGFKRLADRKVAMITNHTGRTLDGRRTIDVLLKAPGVKVLKLFSPEHGLYGMVDEKVGDTTDNQTGLHVYSLYGKTVRPNAEMLEGIDTIVYDIQDIGARFYTYPATLGYAMEDAAKRNIRVIVLDRPNPITGVFVDGPTADANRLGFTAYMREPVVHGMTIGELARMFNGENKLNCDLEVVPCEGWKRTMWYDETNLMWVNPSPNMRNETQAWLYPAICLLEATNVSVGRGTDQPFEYFGAPWIDARRLAAALNDARLPGLRFIPIEFTPTTAKFAKQPCHGIYVLVTDRTAVQPVRSGLTIAWTLRKLFGDKFQVEKVVNLLANAEVTKALTTVADPARLPEMWKDSLEAFKAVRAKYLIYK